MAGSGKYTCAPLVLVKIDIVRMLYNRRAAAHRYLGEARLLGAAEAGLRDEYAKPSCSREGMKKIDDPLR